MTQSLAAFVRGLMSVFVTHTSLHTNNQSHFKAHTHTHTKVPVSTDNTVLPTLKMKSEQLYKMSFAHTIVVVVVVAARQTQLHVQAFVLEEVPSTH